MSYLTVYTDDFLHTTNNDTKNDTEFTELKIVFEEHFEIKTQEGSVLKYLNLKIFQYPLDFSVDQSDHITEIVNE